MTTARTAQTNLDRKPPTMGDSKRARRGYASGKDDYLTRLAKIEGQVRGSRKMIEDDRWCPDVVTQVSSVTRALQEVAVGLLNDHIHCCVVDAVRRSPIDGQEALDEVARTIRQVMSL